MKPMYGIRNKRTDKYLPNPKGKNGTGGSWVEPVDPDEQPPRLFKSARAARIALDKWLQGQWVAHWDYGDSGPAFVDDITVKKVPHRNPNEMEVVIIHLCPEPLK